MLKKYWQHIYSALLMIGILLASFFINVWIEYYFETKNHISMVFVLGVFLISWRTQGYFWGVTASLIGVLAVNYAFTYPYYAFDLRSPECVSSAAVMLMEAPSMVREKLPSEAIPKSPSVSMVRGASPVMVQTS